MQSASFSSSNQNACFGLTSAASATSSSSMVNNWWNEKTEIVETFATRFTLSCTPNCSVDKYYQIFCIMELGILLFHKFIHDKNLTLSCIPQFW